MPRLAKQRIDYLIAVAESVSRRPAPRRRHRDERQCRAALTDADIVALAHYAASLFACRGTIGRTNSSGYDGEGDMIGQRIYSGLSQRGEGRLRPRGRGRRLGVRVRDHRASIPETKVVSRRHREPVRKLLPQHRERFEAGGREPRRPRAGADLHRERGASSRKSSRSSASTAMPRVRPTPRSTPSS